MTLTEVFILALVQGATEFLPVSSSGHLLVARWLLDIPDVEGGAFDAFLHLGTMFAVGAYYWRVWLGIVRRPQELGGVLVAATIPAALAGWLLADYVDRYLRGPNVLAVSFLFTAAVLWWFDSPTPRLRRTSRLLSTETFGAINNLTFRDALAIGLAQVLALVPAVSRSGITIAAGRARGLSRQSATTFSFLMSAPIIAGGSLHGLADILNNGAFSGPHLVLGTLVSFMSGLAAIYILMKLIERMSFVPFVIYLVLLSAAVGILM